MTYEEKLQDPRWQRRRLEILYRDNFTCMLCYDKETTLHVHHKKYIYGKDIWDYPDDNFQTLCKHCHVLQEYLKEYEMSCILSTKTSLRKSSILISAVIDASSTQTFVQFYVYDVDSEKIEHSLSIPMKFIDQLQKLKSDFKNIYPNG